MAKLSLTVGTSSKLAHIFIQNSSSGNGAGLAGLTYSSASLVAYYIREGASSDTSITLGSGTLGTYSSGGFIAVDATNMPGLYEIGIPNAVFSSGAASAVVMLSGATNMAPCVLEYEITLINNQSTGFGLVNASANMVQISSSNVSTSTAQIGVNIVNIAGTASAGTAGYVAPDWSHVNAPSSIVNLSNTTISTVSGNVNGTVSSVVGNVGGNVVGSVASVTGNIGGNVNGSVSSVIGLTTSSITNAVLTTTMTESYPVLGSSFTLAQALYNLVQGFGQMSIVSTTMALLKRNQISPAKSYTLNSASNPTSITEAS